METVRRKEKGEVLQRVQAEHFAEVEGNPSSGGSGVEVPTRLAAAPAKADFSFCLTGVIRIALGRWTPFDKLRANGHFRSG